MSVAYVAVPQEFQPPPCSQPELGWTFSWDNRTCHGAEIHLVCVDGDLNEVVRLLQEQPDSLHLRFTYQLELDWRTIECSGEPIHLAASRGHLEVVRHLLHLRASVDSFVTYGQQDNYDVLFSSVYAGGRGGNHRMVTFLLEEADAEIRPSQIPSLRDWPHLVALEAGDVELATILIRKMVTRRQWERVSEQISKDSRLAERARLLCIQLPKRMRMLLTQAAPLNAAGVAATLKQDAHALLHLVDRMKKEKATIPAIEISHEVTSEDVVAYVLECPEAAGTLLDLLTEPPKAEKRQRPPIRVSFAPRTFFQRLLFREEQKDVVVCYVPEAFWRHVSKSDKKETWHTDICENHTRPVFDVQAKVCMMPNLIGAEFFWAVMQDGSRSLFRNRVVRASIKHTFWYGAVHVVAVKVLLSIWGLAILLLESYLIVEHGIQAKASAQQARRLHDSSEEQSAMMEFHKQSKFTDVLFQPSVLGGNHTRSSVCGDWMVASGLVELMYASAEFIGYYLLGRPSYFFNPYTAWSVLVGSVKVLLLVYGGRNRAFNLVIVLAAWLSVLDMLTLSRRVAFALIPIWQTTRGLGPAYFVTFIAFCAFTHATFAVEDESSVWPSVFHQSFSELFSGGFPESPSVPPVQSVLLYVGVPLFSIFLLNVFIAVISEHYSSQQAQCAVIYERMRGGSCLGYLLRSRVLPCRLLSQKVAFLVGGVAAAGCLTLQVISMWNHRATRFNFPAFLAGILIMLVASYQNRDAPWALGYGEQEDAPKYHLWMFEPLEVEPST